MSASVYSFLGHLFEIDVDSDYKDILRKVLERVKIQVDTSHINQLSKKANKPGFIPFDEFFSNNLEISIKSCHDFITSLLKHYKIVDAFGNSLEMDMELKIEKAVWRILMENKNWRDMHNKYGNIDDENGIHLINMEHSTVYRLFCLFNRFCKVTGSTARLDYSNQKFLLSQLKKINISPPKSENLSAFSNFLHYFHEHNDAFVTIALKEAYDKYVRNILCEGKLQFQEKTITMRNGRLHTELGNKSLIQKMYLLKLYKILC